jgi:hypothetical protein
MLARGQEEEKTMATIEMFGRTGEDDLRSDSFVILRIFATGFQGPLQFNLLTGG